MDINFDQLLADNTKTTDNDTLMLLVAGVRGAGKSFLGGTSGLPTLLIYFGREAHSKAAVQAFGGKVAPVLVDVDPKTNDFLKADEVLKNVKEILNHPDLPSKFGCVMFDGLTVFDYYVNQSTPVLTAKQYKGPEAIEIIYNELLNSFFKLQANKVHVVATIAAEGDVDKSTGELSNITPGLRGYNSCNKVIGAFPDVLCIGKVTIIDDDGTKETKRMLQAGASFNKSGKKMSGESRMLTFGCRIGNIPDQLMPEDGLLPASLRKLIDFKKDASIKVKDMFNSKK